MLLGQSRFDPGDHERSFYGHVSYSHIVVDGSLKLSFNVTAILLTSRDLFSDSSGHGTIFSYDHVTS